MFMKNIYFLRGITMIRKATNSDSRVLAEMAVQMWDDNTVNELETEFLKTLNDEQSAIFIKVVDEIPVGFAQCSLRTDYVEGTKSSPVGYLEGIFVKEEYRKKGYAKELLYACESRSKPFCNLAFHIFLHFAFSNRELICE